MHSFSHQVAPANAGTIHLDLTIPDLLDHGCDRHPNPHALHSFSKNQWTALSNVEFRQIAEELAIGLQHGLELGDRISLFMQSDLSFCIADMACLMAGLVDVPIDLGFDPSDIQYILNHSESKVLICSSLELLRQVAPILPAVPTLKLIVLSAPPNQWQQQLPILPRGLAVLTFDQLRAQGRLLQTESSRQTLRAAIAPTDLATLVYTLSPTGQPRGVMLSHRSIAGNILAAFSGIPALKQSHQETILSFLPLTHIFARTFLYGHLHHSHAIYFSSPNRVAKHLREVKPTLFITVPRLLEKVYDGIQETGSQVTGFKRHIFNWANRLAHQYDISNPPKGWSHLKLQVARRFIFPQWRASFGQKIHYLISGGAALQPHIANFLSAIGLPILQGYGLTETSSVLCYTRGDWNQAGTVGVPIAGVEIAIAPDGEILAQTPYRMNGYYRDLSATQAAIALDGWLHTGDIGKLTAKGLLQITGHKKALFKLSTGKYIAPQPIEDKLRRSPLIQQAIVVGAQHKFASALIFPNLDTLCDQANGMCLALPPEDLMNHPDITALYQKLIDSINADLPHWSTIKRFRLIHLILNLEKADASVHPVFTLKRDEINHLFALEINAMYTPEVAKPEVEAIAPPVTERPTPSRRWIPRFSFLNH